MDDLDMSLDDLAQRNKPAQRQPAANKPRGGGRPNGGPQRSASGGAPKTPYARPPPASSDAPWKHDMYGAPSARASAGTGPGGAPLHASAHPTARLRIENVHYEIMPAQLETIFAQAGPLVDGPKIIYDRAGRSTGIAFVTYGAIADAKLAKDKLDGQKANGEPIRISFVPVPLPRRTEGRTDDRGRAVGAVDNTGKPLLGRLGGLLTTPGGGDSDRRDTRSAASAYQNSSSAPSTRGRGAPRGSTRGGAGGRGGRGGAAGGEPRGKRTPATGDALDDELEAFMRAPPAGDKAVDKTDAMEE